MSNKVKHLKAKQKYPDKWFILFLLAIKVLLLLTPYKTRVAAIHIVCIFVLLSSLFTNLPCITIKAMLEYLQINKTNIYQALQSI